MVDALIAAPVVRAFTACNFLAFADVSFKSDAPPRVRNGSFRAFKAMDAVFEPTRYVLEKFRYITVHRVSNVVTA